VVLPLELCDLPQWSGVKAEIYGANRQHGIRSMFGPTFSDDTPKCLGERGFESRHPNYNEVSLEIARRESAVGREFVMYNI